jgi:hypothetical protein
MLYGLPKIHKPPNIPCRPIVDFNPSPLCNLSKLLEMLLKPLSGKKSSYLRNSLELKEQICSINLDPDETLVSFDVIALYPSISHSLALQVCSTYIQQDIQFKQRTKMEPRNFMTLLKLCLTNTYFVYDFKFYRQIKGLPMGAAISVTVANLVMEHLETSIFNQHPDLTVKFFKRYIDDLICACKKLMVEILLRALNSYNQEIQFTVEYELNNQLPYLDTLVSKNPDGTLEFTVYRKPTHSGRYLSFHSSNPIAHKKSVGSSLFHRALVICSNQTLYDEEKSIIVEDLINNGYPKDFITRIEKDVFTNRKKKLDQLNHQSDISEMEEHIKRLCLPYISGWSEVITRICKQFELDLTHRPMNKLRFVWGNQKCHLPCHKNKDAIYQIGCRDCNLSYIGESNNCDRRIKEHERDFRLKRQDNSALAAHAIKSGHQPDFNSHKILANDNYYQSRKFSESFFIQSSSNSMNKHPGSLPSSYLTADIFKNI